MQKPTEQSMLTASINNNAAYGSASSSFFREGATSSQTINSQSDTCCHMITCCRWASKLCQEAKDEKNSCVKRTSSGIGATFCFILGTICCLPGLECEVSDNTVMMGASVLP